MRRFVAGDPKPNRSRVEAVKNPFSLRVERILARLTSLVIRARILDADRSRHGQSDADQGRGVKICGSVP